MIRDDFIISTTHRTKQKYTQNTQLSHGNENHRFFIHILVLIKPFSPVKLDIYLRKDSTLLNFSMKLVFAVLKTFFLFFSISLCISFLKQFTYNIMLGFVNSSKMIDRP